jgi:hypothetical protein
MIDRRIHKAVAEIKKNNKCEALAAADPDSSAREFRCPCVSLTPAIT